MSGLRARLMPLDPTAEVPIGDTGLSLIVTHVGTTAHGTPAASVQVWNGTALDGDTLDLADKTARWRLAKDSAGHDPATASHQAAIERALFELSVNPPAAPGVTPPAGVGTAGRPDAAATLLLKLAEDGASFWHARDGRAFASVNVTDRTGRRHVEHHAVRSTAFRRWLTRAYHERTGKAASAEPLAAVLNTLESRALFDGECRPIWLRTAKHDGAVYLDLGGPDWTAVRVDAAGWTLVAEPPVAFTRAAGMLALPTPVPGGNLAELRPFLNVAADDFSLVFGWLVAALYPRGPYPVLTLYGEQGSAKTTTARVCRALVDPNANPLRRPARDERDLWLSTRSRWVLAFDNLSSIPAHMADSLCCLSTGGGYSTRELYSDDGEAVFEALRPVLLTAITDVIGDRADLLDRALVVNCPVIDRRQSERAFWAAFDAAAPRLFGALLTALSGALRRLPATRLQTEVRMLDFAELAVAAEPAFGVPAGTFLAAYERRRQDGAESTLEATALAAPLRVLLASTAVQRAGQWSGTATDLLDELNRLAGDATKHRRDWPATPRALGGRLRRIAPALRQLGYGVELDRVGRDRTRLIRLTLPPADGADGADATDGADAKSATERGERSQALGSAGGEAGPVVCAGCGKPTADQCATKDGRRWCRHCFSRQIARPASGVGPGCR